MCSGSNQLPYLKMNGKSIKNSGLFNNVDTDENIPYNNERLDNAVSLDDSQALSGAICEKSGAYASKSIPNSSTRQNEDNEASGIYATRIASSRQQTTSTPEPPPRKHSNAGSGNYAQCIVNLQRSQSDRFYNKHENESNLHSMDRLGNTVLGNQLLHDRHGRYHPPPIMEDGIGLQGLETVGEISDGGSDGKRKIHRETSKKKKRQNNRNSSDIQTPPWANQLLDNNSSLVGKFRNMREQINKWTLRRISQRARIPYTDQASAPAPEPEPQPQVNADDEERRRWEEEKEAERQRQGAEAARRRVEEEEDRRRQEEKERRQREAEERRRRGPFEMLDFESVVNTESKANLFTRLLDKKNNLAIFLFGLILIFILVFPVIVIIVLFTDRADLVQIELSMKLNGSITENFNSGNLEYSLCSQIDLAVASYNGFYGCNVNEFR